MIKISYIIAITFAAAFSIVGRAAEPVRTGDMAGLRGHYLVELDDAATAVDDTSTVAVELARTYGGRLEIYAATGFHGFAVSMNAESARLLAADPHVKAVRETRQTPASATREPGPGAVAPPASATTEPAPRLSFARRIIAPDGAPLAPIVVGPYKYDGAGNIIHMGTDRYTYDEMSRISSGTAVTSQNTDTQQFDYDGFGNLKKVTVPSKSILYIDRDPLTNKLSDTYGSETGTNVLHIWAGGYDAAGNQLATSGTASYTYDSMNMMSELASPHEFYIYDANDERVATVAYSTNTSSVWRYSIRDEGNHVLRTVTDTILDGNHSWQQTEDYVYGTSGLLAAITPQGSSENRKHFHVDHLGSPVLITDDSGQRVATHKYWPFGAEAPGTDADGERLKFTGHERDNGSALDYMHARYYSASVGRFLSADRTVDTEKSMESPLRWNRYAYVMNNPLRYNDPTGRDEQEGWKAGVVVNNSNQTIWVAGDHNNRVVVVPLKPGERSDAYLVDTDAIIPGPSQSIDGQRSGAFKIGASTVSVDGNGPTKLGINRGVGYVANAVVGHAGHVDPATAKKNGWIAPATPKAAADAAKDAASVKQQKQQQERQQEQQQKVEAQKRRWWEVWR